MDHSRDEYGYMDRDTGAKMNTNTIEGYYSIFKRGMKGVYSIAERSICTAILPSLISAIRTARHLALRIEERADILVSGIVGKRLTYRRPDKVTITE